MRRADIYRDFRSISEERYNMKGETVKGKRREELLREQMIVRIPKHQKDLLAARAWDRGISVNAYVCMIIDKALRDQPV